MGASSGIGRATALRFARSGARVVVAARGEPGLRSLIAEIEAGGVTAEAVVADVTDPRRSAQVRAVAEGAVVRFGRLDTWAPGGGSAGRRVRRHHHRGVRPRTAGQPARAGPRAKAALPHLRDRGGAFIAASSMGARRSVPQQTAYCASKHGIDGFAEALRVELEHDGVPVSVTQILPGTINTPLLDNARTKVGSSRRRRSPPIPPWWSPTPSCTRPSTRRATSSPAARPGP